jgi:hypothetical protein
VEPLDADDWLMSIEKKLQVMQCYNREKVIQLHSDRSKLETTKMARIDQGL